MIYLDNAATTKPSQKAAEAMLMSVEEFGNPSSLHGAGLRAEKLINGAKENFAKTLGVDKKNIYFTSGGTEANNLAILGTADALKRRGNRVITSKIEHPSVIEAFKKLEKDGFDVVYVGVNRDGVINLDEFSKALTDDTILVSVMHTNNETGVIQPISDISRLTREKAKNCVIHCDCVQAFGKLPIKPEQLGVDAVSISAHKIHGFKGCGALYTKTRISPLIVGGEQQNEIRPGTENVGGILAFSAALSECSFDADEMRRKRTLMKNLLSEKLDNIVINGSCENNSGSVLNVSFVGIKAEILLHSLERYEIYVSTGSACSSHKPQPSHVLTAMGASQKEIDGAIRISFSQNTTDSEIVYASEKIAEEVKNIRKYM
ncbi:MAG: cysteine desulfurase family protein [Clostridiales bacterium]|nr:cysteine desulfurase family protein [Clostridiales bacterium]